MKKVKRVDELWRGATDKAKLLRECSRKFNNAMALAYEEVLEPELEDTSSWQPSVVIQGNLYHRIGPLTADEGKKKVRFCPHRVLRCASPPSLCDAAAHPAWMRSCPTGFRAALRVRRGRGRGRGGSISCCGGR